MVNMTVIVMELDTAIRVNKSVTVEINHDKYCLGELMSIKQASESGEQAGNEFVDKLMTEITDNVVEQLVLGTVADKLLEGMIQFTIPVNTVVKFLEAFVVMLKKSPGYKE
jgi:hypothetical protein